MKLTTSQLLFRCKGSEISKHNYKMKCFIRFKLHNPLHYPAVFSDRFQRVQRRFSWSFLIIWKHARWVSALGLYVCGNGRASRQEGREGGSWTTYVNLSDRYVNNATHNYQGIKCVPCINKIMLHWGGKNRKTTEEKGQDIRHLKKKRKEGKWKERGEK